ncbi:MAG: molybdopterin-dependent oxidoreductase [Alphaproteobacteria bacterium]|nr:molybdopterin-dependent oxidoreductase [Alphaproteobacteria bacterium]
MLRKTASGRVVRASRGRASATQSGLDRRTFLRRSGLAAGGLAAAALSNGRFAAAQTGTDQSEPARIRTVCGHCGVGCTIMAEVENGVWTGQEPDVDHPISLGGLCARGAGARYATLSDRRLKRPLKLLDGKWTGVTWEQGVTEVANRLLGIRQRFGPDSVYWLGSANLTNEQAYLLGKLAAFWGTNNVDHEGRLLHAAADLGLAQSWGFGAATNSLNDLHHARSILVMGGSPAEDLPLSMLHILRARERNDAPLVVCDPRYSQTAALADEHVRYRPGSDIALLWGLVREIFANRWHDETFIRQRVGGVDRVRAEANKWSPAEVERVTGVPPAQLKRVARALASNRPGAVIWSTPGSQGVLAASTVRAMGVLQMVLGNIGVKGGGVHPLRLYANSQGASDMGLLCDSLPGYYGLSERAWRHWARVWKVDYEVLLEESFGGEKELMERPGIPASRWFDGVLARPDNLDQPGTIRALVIWGHAVHLTSRLPEMREALKSLDLIVNVTPYPSIASVMPERRDGAYLLPSTTPYETEGTVTNTHRAVQWRERVVQPIFSSRTDQAILHLLASRLGLAGNVFRNIGLPAGEPSVEDVNREANSGLVQIGYSGHALTRIKQHMRHGASFDRRTLRAVGGPAAGDYYGLPWPCWGTKDVAHPGTPNLFDTSMPVAEGGACFPAIFGLERDGKIIWAEQSYPDQSEIKDGYPEFTAALLKHLNWESELNDWERATIAAIEGEKTDWRTDLSGGIHRVALAHGCAPFGNGKARAFVWDFPDPVPIHREPLYTQRRDLVTTDGKKSKKKKRVYPTFADGRAYRLPTDLASIQAVDFSLDFPLLLITGRIAEYDTDGASGRANAWLAELRRRMFVEIHPQDANDHGLREGETVWIFGPSGGRIRAAAMITQRVAPGLVFLPVSFAGQWAGASLRALYPEASDAFVLGDSANALMGEGYDPVGQTPEIYCGLCRIEKV